MRLSDWWYRMRCGRDRALLRAVDRADLRTVRRFLAEGAQTHARGLTGRTPLHIAAERGRPRVADLLLDAGAAVDAREDAGCTPLHVTALYGHPAVAALLLDRGADPNAQTGDACADWIDDDGRPVGTQEGLETPLHFAARGDHAAVARHLLTHGSGHREAARLLVARGAAPVSIFAAACIGRRDVLEALLDASPASLQATTHRGRTPLHVAVECGSTDAVAFLLDRGADTEAGDSRGRTPLHMAVARESHALVRVLLAGGADVRVRDTTGVTPQPIATSFAGLSDTTSLEKRGGIMPSAAMRPAGWTPLHHAAGRGHLGIVALLLRHGSDPCAPSGDGTPLAIAERAGHKAVARLLRRFG
jgi:ankyrin